MKKKLRIAFCGASGTGKTTVASQLSEIYKIELNPIGSRSVSKEMGFESPYDVDAFGLRKEFQIKLLESKYNWEKDKQIFITDRTYLDNLVYSMMHCGTSLTKEFIEKCFEYSRIYDFIYYFPIDTFLYLDDDPLRVSNIEYHKVYDKFLSMLLTILDPTYHKHTPLYYDSVEKRVEFISKDIDKWWNKKISDI